MAQSNAASYLLRSDVVAWLAAVVVGVMGVVGCGAYDSAGSENSSPAATGAVTATASITEALTSTATPPLGGFALEAMERVSIGERAEVVGGDVGVLDSSGRWDRRDRLTVEEHARVVKGGGAAPMVCLTLSSMEVVY